VNTPVLIAVISTVGVLLTAVASIGVALVTNRKESENAAENAVDEAFKQQLVAKEGIIRLRDEQLAYCQEQCELMRVQRNSARQELQDFKDRKRENP
jgi:hypothetical protein